MPRITPDWKKEKVLELYSQGVPQLQIERELQMTRKTIRELIKASDLKYKTKSEHWLIRYNNTLNEKAFDELTPEACYWIGFLYADGHIAKNRDYSIEIQLSIVDRDHLEKFKNFLSATNKITLDKKKNLVKLRFGSKKLYERLTGLGFTHNKSYNAIPHPLLKNSKDFWRGVVDGDGCLFNGKYPQLQLCGTEETIQDFINFVDTYFAILKVPRKASGLVLKQVSFYKEYLDVADLLYKDATIYLDRKYKIYESWKTT